MNPSQSPTTRGGQFDTLCDAIARFQAPPHLLSTGADGRPHAVACALAWAGDELVLTVGRRSLDNVAVRPQVTLLWSAAAPGEYSLVIDGEAVIRGEGAAARVLLRPTRAVLHRPSVPDGPRNPRCGSDCVPLFG